MSNPVVSSRTPVGQIINQDGTATFAFLKWMQNIGTTINVTFDSKGVYQGDIGDQATIDGRATLASIVQNISTDGVVQGPGIDFALPYLNKDTDHIADGTGSPLAGGKEAYAVLVASGPASGQTIRFNGADWLPVAIAVSKALAVSQWIRSYDASTGAFTSSQPAFSDISGTSTPAQLPADIAYKSLANTFTANQTVGGDLAVTGNISAANFPGSGSMVYPAVGIGVSTGSAWGPSIDPATVPRTNTANTFTGEGYFTAGANITGGPSIRPNCIRMSNGAGNSFLDATGPNTATQGSLIFRTLNSDASLASNVISLNSAGIAITGTLSASGAKAFVVTHPLDETKELWHCCLEGPENGCFYRGEVETTNGVAEVTLPDYFEALTYPEDRSVLLTVIVDDANPIFGGQVAAGRITNGKFKVYSVDPSATIAWEVKAVRRIGVDHLKVTQAKRDDPLPNPLPNPKEAKPA